MLMYDPYRLSTWIEGLLNSTVQDDIDEEERLTFKVDTLFGKFDTNFFLDSENNKKEYVYSIISDPTGEVVPIKNLGLTNQEFVLHMYFKMSQKKNIYKVLNNLMVLLAGGYFIVPGDESSDSICTNCGFPLIGDADPHSVREVNTRTGRLEKKVEYYIDATIRIYLSTSAAIKSNQFSFYLNDVQIYPTGQIDFIVGTQLDPEQYSNDSCTKSTVSATQKDVDFSFYVNGTPEADTLYDELMMRCFATTSSYNQNEIYVFKIKDHRGIPTTRNVLLKNLKMPIKVGESTYFSCSMTDADTEVLSDE